MRFISGFALACFGVFAACDNGGRSDSTSESIDKPALQDSLALDLVEEYLRRDSVGEFRSANRWLADVTTFLLPGYDAMTVIRSYQVIDVATLGDTTRVTVEYRVIGGMDSGEHGPVWSYADSIEIHSFIVVDTEQGTRLAWPPLNPHVSGWVVLEQVPVDSVTRSRFTAAMEGAAK